jgi:hypothetical protein
MKFRHEKVEWWSLVSKFKIILTNPLNHVVCVNDETSSKIRAFVRKRMDEIIDIKELEFRPRSANEQTMGLTTVVEEI